ncbi:MAG TPA: hypothetical protein PKN95_04800 [Verrucomicrobiota bacterium]|nr:hypothetical protein [Verrucomicrobiota bacterium]HNT15080.1 hypothetical protein [Verrucomicrobiota bacterium]
MIRSLWIVRIFFLVLCCLTGYALSQLRPDLVGPAYSGPLGAFIGFGFGGLLIAIDEMLKGFSLRAFSATTFGLLLGIVVAQLVDHSGLFDRVDDDTRWLVRLALFLGFSYIGMVLAMRSNKEDFSLIIPYVRFSRRSDKADNLLLLDTSVIIDGRIVDLIKANFLEGIIVTPGFVLKELQRLADSAEEGKRTRGRRGLEMLGRIQSNGQLEVKLHEGDFPEEPEVDAKLLRLARNLNARVITNDANLGKVAALQNITCLNLHELARYLKPVLLPGDPLTLKIVREGKDKDQGVAYLSDGTMVVVNQGLAHLGRQVEAVVQSVIQTGAGIIVFANLRSSS